MRNLFKRLVSTSVLGRFNSERGQLYVPVEHPACDSAEGGSTVVCVLARVASRLLVSLRLPTGRGRSVHVSTGRLLGPGHTARVSPAPVSYALLRSV